MKHPSSLSRRQFITRSSALGAAAVLGSPRSGFARSANDRLDVAFIGVGRRGDRNLGYTTETGAVNVAALVDVDGGLLAQAAAKHPGARQYRDFRRLYEDAHLFDAVVVSTPEHTHAVATMPALELGKHVYCEKPLTHNIAEARMVAEAAAKARVVTQMGTQNHARPNFHRVVELVRSGAIGEVHDVHVWVARAWGLQSREAYHRNEDKIFVTERPPAPMSIPADLEWDLWLGPAPERPFHEVYVPGPLWYRWWDFGSGTMSDLGSHYNDLPYWALELDAPRTIEASGPPPHPEIAPASMSVVYEYPARGNRPPVRMSWHQGDDKPEIWKRGEIPQWPSGMLFIGSKGMLLSNYQKHVLLPEEKFADFQRPDPWLEPSIGHHKEWVMASLTGGPTATPFSYGGPLTEANHLGNVAYRVGKKLEWDAKALRVTNSPEANALVSRTPRPGWGY